MFAKFKSCNKQRGLRCRTDGVALVIVLSVVVFLSILVALFLTTTMMNRQLSFSSAGQARAENVAIAGLEATIGDLRSEIVAGSSNSAVKPFIYFPVTNTTIIPSRVGDDGFTNVTKRSVGGLPFWPPGSPYSASINAPIRSVINNSTTNAAANGRYIRPERWNSPFLLGETIPPNFRPPDWVLVTREGAITNAAAIPSLDVLSDSRVGNERYVIGRYAYMVYDQGGLIDVTVGGFPTGVSPFFTSRRGFLSQINLAKVPGIKDAPTLIRWRNEVTSANYEQTMLANTNGFTEVAPGDRTFVSRQDLINYAKEHPAQLDLSALQYLTTFSRVLNAPSYTASGTRKKVGAQDDQFNPSLVDTRVVTPFNRASDQQIAVVNEPLLKYRFPLNRLSLFYSTASDAPSKIGQFFGLARSNPNSPWVYRNGASTILTLVEVAAAGREPDFFELLQAGITYGSLGANRPFSIDGSDTTVEDQKLDAQVMQIGANLIDQYDADSYPVRLQYAGTEVFGIENLPYLTRFYETILRKPGTDNIGVWYQAEVWNPHAQINLSSNPPVRFRFRARGSSGALIMAGAYGSVPYVIGPRVLSESEGISFSGTGNNFTQPLVVSPAMGATATNEDSLSAGGQSLVGINIGSVAISKAEADVGETPDKQGKRYMAMPQTPVTFELQYFDSLSNDFVTYDRIRNVYRGVDVYYSDLDTLRQNGAYMIRSDPRTDRFGVIRGTFGPNQGETLRPNAGDGYKWGSDFYIGLFSDNLTTSSNHYADPDSETRPGDGAYAMPATLAGYPLATNNATSRPVVLNRPFRSVAEMGYASRGTPWKHLDFFSALSGDVALLDLFCLNEPAKANSIEPAVEAGHLSLNTRHLPLIAAVLAGGLKAEDSDSLLSDAEATSFATNLLSLTTGSSGPLVNRSDLVTRWMPNLPATTPDTVIKRRKESVIRALSDLGDTRTWNLLIDIVAQSGRYTLAAKNVNEFLVEGERRYWLHIAIDRYTGKVISRQLEATND